MQGSPVRPPLERPVLEVEGSRCTWADVIEAARAWGTWHAVERDAAAIEAAVATPGIGVPQRMVEERATAFRRRRKLLSVDDTAEWLARWGIPMEAWIRHLRGSLAATVPMSGTASPETTWIQGVVSGTLETAARRLATALAAHRALGGENAPGPDELERSLEHFERTAVTERAVADAIAAHRLDWTILDFEVADAPDEDVAHELLYGVREDARPVADVAADAGVGVKKLRMRLDELSSEELAALGNARAGDVIGPLAVEDAWRVVSVLARRLPGPDDPRSVAHAREQVLAAALAREAARRVRWLDPSVSRAHSASDHDTVGQ